MLVELTYSNSPKTRIRRYKFSVYARQPYGLERVYQLEVTHWPKPVKDQHQKSHEHIGDLRIQGLSSWQLWDFDDVLAHFCKQTGIVFEPTVSHPEHFQLRG